MRSEELLLVPGAVVRLHPLSVPRPGSPTISLAGGVRLVVQCFEDVRQARLIDIVHVLELVFDSHGVGTTNSARDTLQGIGTGCISFARTDATIWLWTLFILAES